MFLLYIMKYSYKEGDFTDHFSRRYSNYVELVFQCYMLEKVEEKKEQ
jgi:hypothetical protein